MTAAGSNDARTAMAADFARRFAEYWSAPTPIALTVAKRPRAWPAFVRSRLRRARP
jgi:hypothetical protein